MQPTSSNDALNAAICHARDQPDLWYWDEDDQREWDPHPEWQELRDSWRDLGPELSQALPLSNVGDPFCTDHILVRQAYLEIASRVLRRQEEAPGTGVLIMGQWGVGKGAFIWYLLRILLMMDEPVLVPRGAYPRLFYKGRAYVPSSPMRREVNFVPHHANMRPLWLLVNTADDSPGALPLEDPRFFPVKTAQSSVGYGEAWAISRGAARFGIPLWSEEELVDGWSFHRRFPSYCPELQDAINGSAPKGDMIGVIFWLNKRHADWRDHTVRDNIITLVKDAIRIVGPIALDAFCFVRNPMECVPRRRDGYVSLPSFGDFMLSLLSLERNILGDLLVIRPAYDPRNPNCDALICDFKSRKLATKAKRTCYAVHPLSVQSSSADVERRQLFWACWRGQPSSVLAKCLFVNIARHALLGQQNTPLELFAMATADRAWTASVDSKSGPRLLLLPPRTAKTFFPIRRSLDAVGVEHVYLPAARTGAPTPTFDAFFFDVDLEDRPPSATLWIFQSTVSAACKSKLDTELRISHLVSDARAHLAAGDVVNVRLNLVLMHPVVRDRTWSWEMPDAWAEDWTVLGCEPHVYHLPISV